MRRTVASRLAYTRCSLFLSWFSKGKDGDEKVKSVVSDIAGGLGTSTAGHSLEGEEEFKKVDRTFFPGGGTTPGSTVPKQDIDDILLSRGKTVRGNKRQPISYDIEVQKLAKQQKEALQEAKTTYDKDFDEMNMPRDPANPARKRADWEFVPTPEHKSLVLLLYRNLLKGLMNYKSVRKRSIIAYARFTFRRRAQATEKLLIDECVEECRRAIYVLQKHHNFTINKTYEFDTMTMPKDTGQDVKTYMEEVYDPEISRQQFQQFTDVQPGKEHLHKQGLSPTSGPNHWMDQKDSSSYKVQLKDEDIARRPPPPPTMS
ncbi:hypothetical protein AGDE_09150 [Angomonas deanei]|nr:hypothetical protein AGDE_09150 [Angomonas deanei]|eukprot:EPY31245.1 hypothetical protein AGDE_09150 [Angomonas deanei]